MNALTVRRFLPAAAALAVAAAFTGCSSQGVKNPSGVPVTEMRPDERGFVAGTGVESQDLVTVTDRMARSILGIPVIAQAANPPVVAIEPVINETRFPINKDIFLTRIRTQLNSKAAGKVSFLAHGSHYWQMPLHRGPYRPVRPAAALSTY